MKKTYTIEEKLELMEPMMKKSWEEIDNILYSINGGFDTDTRQAWAEDWAQAKFPIFQKFGNKLRLEGSVENALSNSEIKDAFYSSFLSKIKSMTMEENEGKIIALYFSSFSLEELQKNRFMTNKEILGESFQAGAKISKSLKRVLKNKKLVNQIQIYLSAFNESLLARGVLEVSIDPLDILMMSVNKTREWSSCHSIIDGCYGAGPVSYLLDGSSFICQIILGSQDSIPDKIWRRMGMFNTELDAILLSRSYPGVNKNNTKALRKLFVDTFGEDNVAYGFIDSPDAENTIRESSEIHYNDITHGAMNKVPMIVLDKQKYNVEGENNSENILRKHFNKDFYDGTDETELCNVRFEVGVDSVISPTCDFTINGSIEAGGLFDEYAYDDEDEYWDDEDDWDY